MIFSINKYLIYDNALYSTECPFYNISMFNVGNNIIPFTTQLFHRVYDIDSDDITMKIKKFILLKKVNCRRNLLFNLYTKQKIRAYFGHASIEMVVW